MKTRRLLLLALAGLAVVLLVTLVASGYWQRKPPVFQNWPKLVAALQGFSRAQVADGRPLPREISLQDLLQAGYLTTNDVTAFDGMEVTFSTQLGDSMPQMLIAWARMADGQIISLLADGSVQQFSPQRFEQFRANLGRTNGPTNATQPIPSDTNPTPSAVKGEKH